MEKKMEEAQFRLSRKVKWLTKLFDIDSRDVEVLLDHTIGGTRLVVRDNNKSEDIFSVNGSDAIVLAALVDWATDLRVYVSVTHEIFVGHKKPSPKKDWKVIAKNVGVVWHDDPTCNELLFGQPWRWDYSFDPVEDPDLLEQYIDDIIDRLA